MSSNKKYWVSVEELKEDSSVVETLQQKEFVEEIPTDEFLGDKESLEKSKTSRRDFLKYVGFSTAAASLAACEGPVTRSIPYVVQPERIIPGVANYYATTMADGFDFANILVKTREGRPIKIENNTIRGSRFSANARVQASVLSLYDKHRIKRPHAAGEPIAWDRFDALVKEALTGVGGKEIAILSQTFASPSTDKLISQFSEVYPNVKHVVYDTVSEDHILTAYQKKFGERALPNYDFLEADVIVSVGADFLGDWQGGGYGAAYAEKRIPTDGKMSRHIQFEANMSLSGAKADKRVPATPSNQKKVLAAIVAILQGRSVNVDLDERLMTAARAAAKQLERAGNKGLLITGIPDVDAQLLTLSVNQGKDVLDLGNPRMIRQGNATEVAELVKRMNAGEIGAVLIAGVNPAYSLPFADEFVEGLKKVDVSVAFSMKMDETAILCDFVAATPHYLESWGDVQLTKMEYGLTQPTIRPLFDTRQFQECLLRWSGISDSYYDYLREVWVSALGNGVWTNALHDGVFVSDVSVFGEYDENITTPEGDNDALSLSRLASAEAPEGLELSLYVKTSMGDGQQANNPWLHELPDPLTRVSWDNYLTMSQHDAREMGISNLHEANGALNSSYVNIKLEDGTEIKQVPVIIQPGQAIGSVGLAFGYGKTEGIQDEMQVGSNAYPFYKNFSSFQKVEIAKAEGEHEFACVQLHNTIMGRKDVIKETTLEIFNSKEVDFWNRIPHVSLNHEPTRVTSDKVDLWEDFDRSVGHHFNMSIDLNACTGCAACVIACHIENNVPVVGKEEVRRSRDMHWLRIDRYYSSEDGFDADLEKKESISGLMDSLTEFREMEIPAEANPQVVFQPMLCQHCNHAPCETVCPVAATSHGRQGQNQMIYNRCVGTRYCANNCPYKVRRFNWFLYNRNDEFDFYMNNDLGRMVLNPDVTVRSRGVMEKCTFCIQRTQKTILDAKREQRPVEVGEFQTACSLACDKGAIVFGDIHQEDSEIVAKKNDKRMYHVLEQLGTKPNVMYQVQVRNTTEA